MFFLLFVIFELTVLSSRTDLMKVTKYDEYYPNNHDLIFSTTGVNEVEYIYKLKQIQYDNDFSEAMRNLILARLLKDKEEKQKFYIEACNRFLRFSTTDKKQIAVTYEAMASLNCLNQSKNWLLSAQYAWVEAGYYERAQILDKLKKGVSQKYSNIALYSDLDLSNKTKVTLNTLSFDTENKKILVQNERTVRDWLSLQMEESFHGKLLSTFLEKKTYNKSELREDIGWHEGARLKDIHANYIPAFSTIVLKRNDSWYAPNEKGEFMFEISVDKMYYPTVFWLSDDLAILFDTHGISNLVEQAIKENVDYVLGCCDYPGKIQASIYLSDHGIKTICHTDRFLYEALGTNSEIIGSPKNIGEKYVSNPITLQRNDKIVVTTTNTPYPYQYYDTPDRYFSKINETFPLQIIKVNIDNYNSTSKVFDVARKSNVSLVGYRVFNSYDYNQAKNWLKESENNHIFLFHSSPYPYGQILMREFGDQVHNTDSVVN